MTCTAAQIGPGRRLPVSTLVVLSGVIALLCCIGTPAQAARSKDALLQVCTVHNLTQSASGYGSGFIASSDGLVITNYHVISQYALQPDRYRIEFVRSDGSRGRLKLLAIDISNDLALLQMPGGKLPVRLREAALTMGDHHARRLFGQAERFGFPRELATQLVNRQAWLRLAPLSAERRHSVSGSGAAPQDSALLRRSATVFRARTPFQRTPSR